MSDTIVLLFALRRESMYFLRAAPNLRRVQNGPCPAWRGAVDGSSVVLLETGVGRTKTLQILEWLQQSRAIPGCPRLIVAAGFGGGLDPALKVGDVVQARQVVDEEDNSWTAQPAFPDQPAHRLLTAARLAAKVMEKARLAARHSAQVVDMESAAVARHCAERGIPLVCLRGISDDAATELSPHLIPLLSGGRVAARRLLWALCRRPCLVRQLWRLGRNARRAGQALALALRRFMHNHSVSRT